jgi:ATP-binding cassette subfamily B protein
MASKPLPPDKQKLATEEAVELDDKLVPVKPDLEDDEDDEDEEDDELELDDDDEDEELVVFTAREAAGAR